MPENTDLSKYASTFAEKAQTSVDAQTPFAAAEGIAKTAVTEASESKINAKQDIIDYDRAKTELKMIGASSTVVEAGNAVLDVLKTGTQWFAEKLQNRGAKLLTRSEKQRATAKAVEQARENMNIKQGQQDIENAKLDQVAPHLSASRGLWGETGGRVLEWAGVKVREITTKPIAELYSKGNHLEATILNTGADVLNDGSEWVSEIAKEISAKVQEKISKRKAEKTADVNMARKTAEKSQDYAQFAADVKNNVANADFLMPDASAASRSIKQADGDTKSHAELNSVTKEWTDRVTTTTK